jgi:hypothetical protein
MASAMGNAAFSRSAGGKPVLARDTPPAGKAPAGAQLAPKRFDAPRDGGDDPRRRPGLAAFEAMVARDAAAGTEQEPAPQPAPALPAAEPGAAAPDAATADAAAAAVATPPSTPADAGLPSDAAGLVSVPTEPTEGE